MAKLADFQPSDVNQCTSHTSPGVASDNDGELS
jgi:hypothetical protein